MLKCLLATLFLLGLIFPAQCQTRSDTRPNIIFILADDLGYGDLGSYGQKWIRTPNLDRMAREGMRFTQFYAGSTVCAPSRCALMTGLHTGHSIVRGNNSFGLRPNENTIAKTLKQAGYHTGLIGKWGLGDEGSAGVPLCQGFDYFYGYLNHIHAHNNYPRFLCRNNGRVLLRNVVANEGSDGQGMATTRRQYSNDLFAWEARRYIDANKDNPFFLYLAFTIPHANNEARRYGMEVPSHGIYRDKLWPNSEKGYAAMITRLDSYVGSLMAHLRQLGLDKNTLVIFSSDNGPHNEGYHNPLFFGSGGPLRGIKRDLYEGGVRIPMIARWPDTIPAGVVSNQVGWFPDFFPTLTRLAGAQTPRGLDGVNLLPTLFGQPNRQKQHPYLYWEFNERGFSQAARVGDWKGLYMNAGLPMQLFDLRSDRGETRDVAAEHPNVVAKLQKVMQKAHVPAPTWQSPGEKSRLPLPATLAAAPSPRPAR